MSYLSDFAHSVPASKPHGLAIAYVKNGKVTIKCFFDDTYIVPSDHKFYEFSGKYGRVLIGFRQALHDIISEDDRGKILRYVRNTLYTNHNLKFIGVYKNE